jgi:flagellar biosynthesis component FlhA
MTGDLREQPRCAGRIAFLKLAVVAVIAGAALMSACSQPSDSQQTAAQQQQAADEQTRKEADEKAWADAEKTGTVAAYTAYLQNFGAGAHVSEASQRIVALNESPS